MIVQGKDFRYNDRNFLPSFLQTQQPQTKHQHQHEKLPELGLDESKQDQFIVAEEKELKKAEEHEENAGSKTMGDDLANEEGKGREEEMKNG